MGEPEDNVNPDDTHAVDAQYKPFPSFAEWKADVSVDLTAWQEAGARFGGLASSATDEVLKRAQAVAIRAAAFDTGAIEGLYATNRGLTLTVAQQTAAWEQDVNEQGGDNALALFTAQLSAFELVLDLAAGAFPQITEVWIRRLHEEVTAAQDTYTVQTPSGPQKRPLPRGKYKTDPNHVVAADGDIHAYAPVDQTAPEMGRLIKELDSEAFRAANPIFQASFAHYAFVAVHPFADGNGRVARALASTYTYKSDRIPLLILDDHRERYFRDLSLADGGNYEPFVEFVMAAGIDALRMVTASLESAQTPDPMDVLSSFKDLYLAQGELSHGQLDSLANTVLDDFAAIANELKDEAILPEGLTIKITPGQGRTQGQIPDGYRSVVNPGSRYVTFDFRSRPPAQGRFQRVVELFANAGPDSTKTLIFTGGMVSEDHETTLEFGLTDVYPALSTASRHRMREFIRSIFGIGLTQMFAEAKDSLERTGYRHDGV